MSQQDDGFVLGHSPLLAGNAGGNVDPINPISRSASRSSSHPTSLTSDGMPRRTSSHMSRVTSSASDLSRAPSGAASSRGGGSPKLFKGRKPGSQSPSQQVHSIPYSSDSDFERMSSISSAKRVSLVGSPPLDKLRRTLSSSAGGPLDEMQRRVSSSSRRVSVLCGGPRDEMQRRLSSSSRRVSALSGGPRDEMQRILSSSDEVRRRTPSSSGGPQPTISRKPSSAASTGSRVAWREPHADWQSESQRSFRTEAVVELDRGDGVSEQRKETYRIPSGFAQTSILQRDRLVRGKNLYQQACREGLVMQGEKLDRIAASLKARNGQLIRQHLMEQHRRTALHYLRNAKTWPQGMLLHGVTDASPQVDRVLASNGMAGRKNMGLLRPLRVDSRALTVCDSDEGGTVHKKMNLSDKLGGEGVEVRPLLFSEGDVGALWEVLGEEAGCQGDRQQLEQTVRAAGARGCVFCVLVDGVVEGAMSVYRVSGIHMTAKVGRWIFAPGKRWGFTHLEGLAIVLDHVFVTCGLVRVHTTCLPHLEQHGDLQKLLDLGFKFEGFTSGPTGEAEVMMRMLKSEWVGRAGGDGGCKKVVLEASAAGGLTSHVLGDQGEGSMREDRIASDVDRGVARHGDGKDLEGNGLVGAEVQMREIVAEKYDEAMIELARKGDEETKASAKSWRRQSLNGADGLDSAALLNSFLGLPFEDDQQVAPIAVLDSSAKQRGSRASLDYAPILSPILGSPLNVREGTLAAGMRGGEAWDQGPEDRTADIQEVEEDEEEIEFGTQQQSPRAGDAQMEGTWQWQFADGEGRGSTSRSGPSDRRAGSGDIQRRRSSGSWRGGEGDGFARRPSVLSAYEMDEEKVQAMREMNREEACARFFQSGEAELHKDAGKEGHWGGQPGQHLWKLQGEDQEWRGFEVLGLRDITKGPRWNEGEPDTDRRARSPQNDDGEENALEASDNGLWGQTSPLAATGSPMSVGTPLSPASPQLISPQSPGSAHVSSPQQGVLTVIGEVFFRRLRGCADEVEIGQRRFRCRSEGVYESFHILLTFLFSQGAKKVSILHATSDMKGLLCLCRCGFVLDAVFESYFISKGFSHCVARLSVSHHDFESRVSATLERLVAVTRASYQGIPFTQHHPVTRQYKAHFGCGRIGLSLSEHAPVFAKSVTEGSQAAKHSLLVADVDPETGPWILTVNGIDVTLAGRGEILEIMRAASRPMEVLFASRAVRDNKVMARSVGEWVHVLSGGW